MIEAEYKYNGDCNLFKSNIQFNDVIENTKKLWIHSHISNGKNVPLPKILIL
jgi:hypothetical protein